LCIWLASIGERPNSSTDPPERALRMSPLVDAIVREEVTWWSTAFDHTHKRVVTPRGMRYRVRRYEVIFTAAAGYAPFGYSRPILAPETISLANKFWNELLENGRLSPRFDCA
jgi:hypothetical protein